MSTNLDGAIVAVVGASGGLGALIARRLGDRGARLVLAGRRTDRLDALGIDGASTVALDIRNVDAGDSLVAAAHDVAIEELFLTNVLGPPPRTETGLAGRPLAGASPSLPEGLSPERVAERIVTAIEADETEVSAEQF